MEQFEGFEIVQGLANLRVRPLMAGSSQHGKQRLASVASNWVVAAYLKNRYFATRSLENKAYF